MFWTQFLGAFNDNVFRNAIAILVAYRAMTLAGLGSETLVVAFPGIFILPFFLFSATAGQLADRFVKAHLIRGVKAAEICIMATAGVGFALASLPILITVLFLMGAQSAFFGPAKYSILPDLLDERSLVGANALVETGTFLAILLGTVAAGLLADLRGDWTSWVGLVVVTVAAVGLLASLFIPRTPPASPGLRIGVSPVAPTRRILEVAAADRTIKLTILGLSWFWFVGAAFLALLPNFSRDVLGCDTPVLTMFLAVFCVGIGVGSLLCERLSHRRLELGLVPLGSIGISLFAVDLGIVSGLFQGAPAAELLRIPAFVAVQGSWRITADLLLIAVFSGFYTVPLFTLLQQRPEPAVRSRVIAANNIVNSVFIVGASLVLMALLAVGLRIPQIFVVLAVLNLVVAAYIYTVIPEFLLRFAAWCVANVMYRIKIVGDENIPDQGPAVLVANHVSFVDWLLIASVSARPVRFVMDAAFVRRLLLLRFLFRDAKVIPIAPATDDPPLLDAAFDRIAAELEDGQVVCLFPEGAITRDGRLQPFRPGIERIVAQTPVPVVPVALCGLWGSFFSRRWGGRAMTRPFRRLWSRIRVVVGEPVPAAEVTAHALAERVAALGGWEAPPFHGPEASGAGMNSKLKIEN